MLMQTQQRNNAQKMLFTFSMYDIFVTVSVVEYVRELMSRGAEKEHETYASFQVPSQSKFIGHYN